MHANPTYKQLEASMRISAFTLWQWVEVSISSLVALVFGIYISPFTTTATLFVSIVLAGSPVALSYGAMAHEWSVADALRAQWAWFMRPRRYLPGAGAASCGYLVEATAPQPEAECRTVQREEPAVLWDL
jgi:hypothetical protein